MSLKPSPTSEEDGEFRKNLEKSRSDDQRGRSRALGLNILK